MVELSYNKYSLNNIYNIYYNIDYYNSRIYNSYKINLLINKKKILINKYNLLHKILKKYLKYNLEDTITNNINIDLYNARINRIIKLKIIKLQNEINDIEIKIKKIEWEEDLIINAFKINKFSIINILKKQFKCFS
jgi:hypothetical protein